MSTSIPPDFNAQIIDEFHANDGVVGGMFENMTLLLLHDKGAKSGKPSTPTRSPTTATTGAI